MSEWALLVGQIYNGLSVASILLLAAIGLALSFGFMRVINMAHGEFLMFGGYLAYLSYQLLPGPMYVFVALALGFLGAALLGGVLELLLIRHLYRRSLDTLLATWGVSLIFQQLARNLFGPTGVAVTAPSWLSGTFTVESGPLSGLVLPHVRLFVIGFTVLILAVLYLLLQNTKIGLYVRAVNQDREIAESLGVHTRWIDFLVFSLGSGLAGLAGATLALIAPVTPTVGQSYIVDAFLVVILGGIGSLSGTALASVLVGLVSATLQTFTSVSFAKVILLVLVIGFLQCRPRGLIATRSRELKEV
ncbi:urea ABC transporter permease subunit UrtB [Atrimonas thermophila]|uniref:urea ABC transporter permease subunit UrtB n=1 Tax=Atrimonas thermophila TaxID=3064161 RepID=UPI00399D1183